MRISRSGRTGGDFGKELEKLAEKMPGSDKNIEERLSLNRDKHDLEHQSGTEEILLGEDRKNDKDIGNSLIEKNLREHGADAEASGITENQLNTAKSEIYPHRNEKAYERTGDKRPVNALDEEMGSAGDGNKLKRYENASKNDQPERILDKDIGKQLTNEKTKTKSAGFNLRQERLAKTDKTAGDYVAYMMYKESGKYNRKFAEVEKLDDVMAGIIKAASEAGRQLTDDELAQISALKERKSEILNVVPKNK